LQAIILEKTVLDWLLAGPAWLRYAVELQLLDSKPDAAPVLQDDSIKRLIRRLKGTAAGIPALKSGSVHYTETGKAYWDLFFLADIGLTIADTGLENEAEEIFRYQSADGSFTIPPNVRENYFCMSAILISSLAKMGYRDDPRVIKYARLTMSQQMPGGGWDCYAYDYGPGYSCPMDDMNVLMLLGQYLDYCANPKLNGAIDHLLRHWETGDNIYGFGVGKRFKSLQYPAVKYGILRVLDALSLFPYAVGRTGFKSMLDYVHNKAADGRYFAGTTEPAYDDFDFARVNEPSRWITFLIARIDKRVAEMG
jgi:hypothetical protein